MKIIILFLFFILSSCSAQTPQFNKTSAFEFLKKQVAFGPRNPGSKGHTLCGDYIISTLKGYGADVKIQNFTFFDKRFNVKYNHRNIIAAFKPTLKSRVILAAHWDTNPIAEKDPDPKKKKLPILGANDGASGVAVLLEIARNLQKNPNVQYGIDLVFFDAEDLGDENNSDNYCIGSKEFAKVMKGKYAPQFGILLDLVGGKNLKIQKEYYSNLQAKFVLEKVFETASDLGFDNIFVNEDGGAINDDHVPLLNAGIPIVDLIDIEIVSNKNNIHHTHKDNLENIDPQSLYYVGQVVLEMIYTKSI